MHFVFVLFNVYSWKREGECKHGRGRQRGRHRTRSRLQAVSTEPDMGLELTVRSWPELKAGCLTDWATQALQWKMHLMHPMYWPSRLGLAELRRAQNTYVSLQLGKIIGHKVVEYRPESEKRLVVWVQGWWCIYRWLTLMVVWLTGSCGCPHIRRQDHAI